MKRKNIFWGLLFIAGAGIVLLSVFDIFGSDISWFTVLISVLLVACIANSLIDLEWGGVFFPLALLAVIFRPQLAKLLNFNMKPWPFFWALMGVALLLSIGFSTIIQKKGKKSWIKFEANMNGKCKSSIPENFTGEKLYFKEQFTGTSKYINSDNLSYVQLLNRFGGMEVYFSSATLAPEGAVVDIECKFGGVELYVPRGWNIDNQISSFAAGVECPNESWTEGAPTLRLIGDVKFGGVEVKLV